MSTTIRPPEQRPGPPGPRRRPVAALVAAAVLALLGPLLVAPGATASAATDPGSAEADFVARINQLRASRGLSTLSVDGELTSAARQWASTMAAKGEIFHASDLSGGVSANWTKLGENVGVGGDVASLFQAFVDSPSHFENLVDPSYSRVGVGVVVSGDRIFTTHRFMAVGPTAPPPTSPPTTTTPPTTAPPTTTPPTTAAPSTTAPTTTAPEEQPKLGPLQRIAPLVDRDQRASTTN